MKMRDDEPSPVDLTPLKNASDAPVFDPARERALLAAFDAAQHGPRSVAANWRSLSYLAAAAVVIVAAGAAILVERRPNLIEHGRTPVLTAHAAPQIASVQTTMHASNTIVPSTSARRTGAPGVAQRTSAPSHLAPSHLAPSAFVPWPGAETLPAFESGRLMRLDLPESVAISLGLTPRAPGSGIVRADLLVGQDGLARAVRVAP